MLWRLSVTASVGIHRELSRGGTIHEAEVERVNSKVAGAASVLTQRSAFPFGSRMALNGQSTSALTEKSLPDVVPQPPYLTPVTSVDNACHDTPNTMIRHRCSVKSLEDDSFSCDALAHRGIGMNSKPGPRDDRNTQICAWDPADGERPACGRPTCCLSCSLKDILCAVRSPATISSPIGHKRTGSWGDAPRCDLGAHHPCKPTLPPELTLAV